MIDTDKYCHMVFGIRSSDGKRVRLAPEMEFKTGKIKIFFWNVKEYQYLSVKDGCELDRVKAVAIAKTYINDKYQDVFVVRYNGCDEMGNGYCNSIIWENGKFVNRYTEMDMFSNIKYEGLD